MQRQIINVFSTNCQQDHLSRVDMLHWVNTTLDARCLKIEEFGTGAAYCLLLEKLFPGCVGIRRIKLNTKLEYESIQNFKLLQQAFKKLGIDKEIPVANLVKIKFQDNWAFIQWFYKFFKANKGDNDENYNPLEARGGQPLGNGATVGVGGAGGARRSAGGGGGGGDERRLVTSTARTPRVARTPHMAAATQTSRTSRFVRNVARSPQ